MRWLGEWIPPSRVFFSFNFLRTNEYVMIRPGNTNLLRFLSLENPKASTLFFFFNVSFVITFSPPPAECPVIRPFLGDKKNDEEQKRTFSPKIHILCGECSPEIMRMRTQKRGTLPWAPQCLCSSAGLLTFPGCLAVTREWSLLAII